MVLGFLRCVWAKFVVKKGFMLRGWVSNSEVSKVWFRDLRLVLWGQWGYCDGCVGGRRANVWGWFVGITGVGVESLNVRWWV